MPRKEAKDKPKRRGCRRFFVLALVVGLVAPLFWAQSPKQYALQYAASYVLGGRVAISGLHIVPRLHLDTLQVYPPDAPDAVLAAQDIDLRYRLLPSAGRFVSVLTASKVRVTLDARKSDHTNYGFLVDLLQGSQQSTGGASARFLPERVQVDAVDFEATSPEMHLAVASVPVTVTIRSTDDIEADIVGDELHGGWNIPDHDLTRKFEQGRIDGHFAYRNGALDVQLTQMDLPGLAQGTATGAIQTAGGAVHVKADVPQLELGTLRLGPLFTAFGLPAVQFDGLKVTDSAVDAVFGDTITLTAASVDAAFSGLQVGPSGEAWYEGPLTVEMTHEGGPQPQVNADLTLAHGQTLNASATLLDGAVRAKGRVENWSRDDLESALPAFARPKLAHATTLSRIGASAELYWSAPRYTIDTHVDAVLDIPAGRQTEKLALQLQGGGALSAQPPNLFAGTASVALGDQTIQCEVQAPTPADLSAKVTLTGIDLRRWARAGLGSDRPEVPGAVVDGTADVTADAATSGYFADLDLTLSHVAIGVEKSASASPLAVQGTVLAVPAENRIRTKHLAFSVGDSTSLVLSDAVVSFTDFAASGDLDGTMDAAWLGGIMGTDALWGELDLHLPLRNEKGYLSSAFRVTAPSLGYGDLTIPYGTSLETKGTLVYDTLKGQLRGKAVTLTLGDGTHAESDGWTLKTSPLRGELPFQLTTDLHPVVAMGYLDSAQGETHVKGRVALGDAGARVDADVSARLDSLVLPSNFALATGCVVDARVGYADGLDGSGTLKVADLVVAGAHVRELSGPLTFAGDSLFAKPLAGKLFDGTVSAEADIGMLKDTVPVHITAQGERLDLAKLVEEVQPPEVTMTGIASATVDARLSANGIDGANIKADAPDGMTLNRDFVQQILLSQYMKDVSGGKHLSKVVKQVVGEKEQRPFQSASLEMALENGALRGTAALKSEALNLTIDLNVDPEVLVEAMKLSSQDVLKNIEHVQTQPLQWSE